MSQGYIPRIGPPALDVAVPSAAQGTSGAPEISPVAEGRQYEEAGGFDVRRSLDTLSAGVSNLPVQVLRVLTRLGMIEVNESRLVDEKTTLIGLRFTKFASPGLFFEFDQPPDVYRVQTSYQPGPVVLYLETADLGGFELRAFDVVAAAPVDLTIGRHQFGLLVLEN